MAALGIGGLLSLVAAVRGQASGIRSRWEAAFYLIAPLLYIIPPGLHQGRPALERGARLSGGFGLATWVVVDLIRRWRELPVVTSKGSPRPKPAVDTVTAGEIPRTVPWRAELRAVAAELTVEFAPLVPEHMALAARAHRHRSLRRWCIQDCLCLERIFEYGSCEVIEAVTTRRLHGGPWRDLQTVTAAADRLRSALPALIADP